MMEIEDLKFEGVVGVSLIKVFIRHQVQPIKSRVHPMYQYKG